jgi:hypothetical protein
MQMMILSWTLQVRELLRIGNKRERVQITVLRADVTLCVNQTCNGQGTINILKGHTYPISVWHIQGYGGNVAQLGWSIN